MKAEGEFEVNLDPLDISVEGIDGISLGRMALAKRYQGDLEATGQGEMLTVRTAVEGSAGYVAIEQVKGRLNGRQGTFVLQHAGMMARGENRLVLEVVPDSGTGHLAGLTGSMEISMEGEQHYYTFEYRLL